MAKNTGLGKGLDSLIPDISLEEDQEEETISLEDLLKKDSSDEDNEDLNDNQVQEEETEEVQLEEQEEQQENPENQEQEIIEEEVVEIKKEELEEDQVEEIEDISTSKNDSSDASEDDVKIVEEPIQNIEDNDDSTQIIEEESHENDVDVLLTKKQEEDICKVIEIVENNPRITLWSAKSAAVLRYLRKTEPEFSISNEASKLIEEAIAEKYPEIWTLFDHL
ncbi:MAG: AAA family ATPase [archaeon]|nr:AAA family ATPase [archaeon]